MKTSADKRELPKELEGLKRFYIEPLPTKQAIDWEEKFYASIPEGADLSLLWPKFVVFMLSDKKYGVLQISRELNFPLVCDPIQNALSVFQEWVRTGKKPIQDSFVTAFKVSAKEGALLNQVDTSKIKKLSTPEINTVVKDIVSSAVDSAVCCAYTSACAANTSLDSHSDMYNSNLNAYTTAKIWYRANMGSSDEARACFSKKLLQILMEAKK